MRRNPLWLLPAAAAVAAALLVPALVYGGINLQYLSVYGDYWHNYDFRTTTPAVAAADWPVTMVWGCNANVTRVDNYLKAIGYPDSGGAMYAHVYESLYGREWWDSDGGRQNTCYCVWNSAQSAYDGYKRHTRLYGYSGAYLYNTTWGYYVIATTHYDINHAGCDRKKCQGGSVAGTERFGWSESVENTIRSRASSDYTVRDPDYNAQNYGYFDMGANYHQSDGRTAYVCMSP
jgi:hypothetical protein